MRTILIWDQCGEEPITFAVLEGDYSHLNGVYINSTSSTDQQMDELSNLLYDDTSGHIRRKMFDAFPLPLEPGDKVIVAGFIP